MTQCQANVNSISTVFLRICPPVSSSKGYNAEYQRVSPEDKLENIVYTKGCGREYRIGFNCLSIVEYVLIVRIGFWLYRSCQ